MKQSLTALVTCIPMCIHIQNAGVATQSPNKTAQSHLLLKPATDYQFLHEFHSSPVYSGKQLHYFTTASSFLHYRYKLLLEMAV